MNGSWARATWWYNACLVMQTYFAAVSMSSQRGSMVGPGSAICSCCSDAVSGDGMTSLGSMATSRSCAEVSLGRTSCDALSASPGVWSGAALGISGPCDRRGLKPRHLESVVSPERALIHGTRRRAAD